MLHAGIFDSHNNGLVGRFHLPAVPVWKRSVRGVRGLNTGEAVNIRRLHMILPA